MLCPSCGKLISVSAEKCPHCGAAKPGLWGFGPGLSRLLHGRLDPVGLILPVCITLYVLALALQPSAILDMRGGFFGLLSPGGGALRALGSTSAYDLLHGRYWTLLTAIYLHGGILHIFFNMMCTRVLAPEVARGFGPARFFVIWTVAGAVGFFLSGLLPILGIVEPHGSLGASGSVFGLLGALIVYGRATGSSLMTRQIWQWVIILGVFGFLFPGVDNAAHAGGFAGGWVVAQMYQGSIGRPDGRGTTFLALGLLAATALGFLIQIFSILALLFR
jgi:rhomboid protease GluP